LFLNNFTIIESNSYAVLKVFVWNQNSNCLAILGFLTHSNFSNKIVWKFYFVSSEKQGNLKLLTVKQCSKLMDKHQQSVFENKSKNSSDMN
jgi:hypothetical protein